jgi:hypothetical protein
VNLNAFFLYVIYLFCFALCWHHDYANVCIFEALVD